MTASVYEPQNEIIVTVIVTKCALARRKQYIKKRIPSLVQAVSVSLVLIPDINILQPFSCCDDVDKHGFRREKDELMFLFYS